LDSQTAAEMMALFLRLRDLYETSFLLISHDPETLAVADRIMVMYAGEIIECGRRQEILESPKHPYTAALLQCSQSGVSSSSVSRYKRLPCIPGRAPDPVEALVGCSFASRCSGRMAACETQAPETIQISLSHTARCFKYETGVPTS
jgi:oligopeptide/dipeptide ABC transporter ATP-binding protein